MLFLVLNSRFSGFNVGCFGFENSPGKFTKIAEIKLLYELEVAA